MDRFRALEVFCRIVDAGSFSKAGLDLGVPPATVSKMIKDLETGLGVRLLERTTRRVSVTDEGRAYYVRATDILQNLAEADDEIRANNAELQGRVRIAAPRHLASAILVPAIHDFVEEHPNLEIEFVLADRRVDMIEDGIDIAIRIGPLADSGHMVRKLGEFPRVTCASPKFLETVTLGADPTELTELNNLAYHFPSAMTGYPWEFSKDEKSLSFVPSGRVIFDDLDAYVDAACEGLGVIQVLWFQAKRSLDHSRLIPLFADWSGATVPVWALVSERRHIPKRTRGVLDWLRLIISDAEAKAKNDVATWQT